VTKKLSIMTDTKFLSVDVSVVQDREKQLREDLSQLVGVWITLDVLVSPLNPRFQWLNET